MRYKVEHIVSYKYRSALCSKYFKDDEVEKARKFAAAHDTFHCAILMWQVDENAPKHQRNQWLYSETPLPFKLDGEWVQVFNRKDSRNEQHS